MHKLSLWYLITIHTFCLNASEKIYPEYQNISLTSILLPRSNHTVDLEHVEFFTNKSIKDSIHEAKETDTPWLLALCHNESNSQIYNALYLTAWCIPSNKDPRTNKRITGIDFFKFEHVNEQININYMGNIEDLKDHNSLLNMIASYLQTKNIEQKNDLALHISRFYDKQANDLPTAIRWCQKAAQNDHLDAIAELGYLFKESGDIDKAFFYLKKAAEQGDTYSAINLGYLYVKNGDRQQALHWLEIGARQGIPDAMRQLGNLYYRLGRTTKAIEWLTAGAMHNNPPAIADLAFVYRTKNELGRALDLYLKAAELDHPTLDLFYTLHITIGYLAYENSEKLQKYADMLVDKINQQDQYITSFKAIFPVWYHTAVDMVKRYAAKQIIYSEN